MNDPIGTVRAPLAGWTLGASALHPKLVACVALAGVLGAPGSAPAQVLRFVSATDTIRVPQQTVLSTAATFEARIMIPVEGTPSGALYHEQSDAQEDKKLACAGDSAGGIAWTSFAYEHRGSYPGFAPLADGLWHHVAYVKDGGEERFYVDGVRVYAAAWPEPIANSSSSGPMALGASQFGYFQGAALVSVDWLRLSDSARYSGAFSPPPECEPNGDANTIVLFLFDDPAGSLVALDSGPARTDGTLGVGFAGATSPVFEANASGNGKPSFTQPRPAGVCPSGTARFSVAVVGPGAPTYRWQWREAGVGDVWVDVVDGVNDDAGGVGRFTAKGATDPSLGVTRAGGPAGSLGVIAGVRCVVTNGCGSVTSDEAALGVCVADFNCDGVVNSTDVSDFINQWFQDQVDGTLVTDWDGNGVVNSTDVSEFINSWFEDAVGCG
jgi:hypothetical protein